MSFVIADEEENSVLFNEFGFDDSSEEVNVGIIGPGDRKYPMEPMEEFDSDDVEKFLKIFMKGMFTLLTISLLLTQDTCLVRNASCLLCHMFMFAVVLHWCFDTV